MYVPKGREEVGIDPCTDRRVGETWSRLALPLPPASLRARVPPSTAESCRMRRRTNASARSARRGGAASRGGRGGAVCYTSETNQHQRSSAELCQDLIRKTVSCAFEQLYTFIHDLYKRKR